VDVMRVPDGAAITDGSYGGMTGAGTGPLMLEGAEQDSEVSIKGTTGQIQAKERVLKHAIQCYICKKHFRELHHFYDQVNASKMPLDSSSLSFPPEMLILIWRIVFSCALNVRL